MRYIKTLLFISFSILCCSNARFLNTEKIYIHQIPSEDIIIVATNIIVNKLDKEKIYTKKQMLGVLNNGNFEKHNCKIKNHLIINFTMGKWSEKYKRYCIFSNNKKLKGKCLIGLFNGSHTISMISNSKIHKTAFAHELLHYFRRYIDGPSQESHAPKELWERLVGYGLNDQIGILNEELKKAGL